MLSEIEKLHIKVGRVFHKVPYAECFGQWSDGLYQVASHLLRIRIYKHRLSCWSPYKGEAMAQWQIDNIFDFCLI